MLKQLQEKLGPGLLYAATAIGVSHLISSTQAGANFGLIMIGYMVFMCLLKYPTFLFGAQYTAATGESLIGGYERKGRWILFLFFLMQMFEYTMAISGVAVTTSALFQSIFNLKLNIILLQFILVGACLAILAIGKYALLEGITKVLVIIMTFGVIAAAGIAVFGVDTQGADLSATLIFDKTTLLFLIAVAGWMPTGMAGAVAISVWVKAKEERLGRNIPINEAKFDFNLGYGASIFTAICFVTMGSLLMYAPGVKVAGGGAAYADQLMSLFTQTLGGWTYPIIAIAAITVMGSTLLTLVDLLPRTSSVIVTRLMPEKFSDSNKQAHLYIGFIAVELILVFIVLTTLQDPQKFGEFMQLVTSLGFVVAPIIAFLNHIVMFSDVVPKDKQPGQGLRVWSYITIASMLAISLILLYLNVT